MAHAALKQAVKSGLIARNVAEATSPPRQERKETRVLSREEEAKLLAVLDRDRLDAAIFVALTTGLRCGELLGLEWSDINWEAGTLTVNRNLVQVREDGKARLVFQEPKTEAGRRTIPLPEEVLKALRAHKARQAQERLAAGCGYRDHGLVFCTSIGTPVNPRNLVRSFHRLCKLAGIERANLHSLRHTFATRLLEANEHPKVVQELLGGSQIGVVLDLYSHVSMDLKRRAMERLDQELKRKALAQEGRE